MPWRLRLQAAYQFSKPSLLRSGSGVAGQACHAVACDMQFSSTQAKEGVPLAMRIPDSRSHYSIIVPEDTMARAADYLNGLREGRLQPGETGRRWSGWSLQTSSAIAMPHRVCEAGRN